MTGWRNKKLILIVAVIIVLLLIVLFFFRSSVSKQRNAIDCAKKLYNQNKLEGVEFESQCLGVCGDYAVDIVHVPRNSDDNKPENQCVAYREGDVNHFIELDKDGNIVRIV